ncbi:hypothetical protein GGE09_004583 [Roseobacter sp. N2S]|nr:hypothetical protein [Roseobacter sp. N2S]
MHEHNLEEHHVTNIHEHNLEEHHVTNFISDRPAHAGQN